ncbi:DEAD/DEAH box helicase [Burkholderia sp. JKS000303]|uniref:DEAD/DEAH box helicase n=1 Tax=Burkholderia sp. JKS000303 TaxID=1938747 RepID=UPI000BF429D1
MSFASLGLIEPLLRNLQNLNYQTSTPVQAKAIPAVPGGTDVMAAQRPEAAQQTGRGGEASANADQRTTRAS